MDPVVHLTLRSALAALLAAAAAHKLRDWSTFRAIVADYRLVPAGLAPIASGMVVAIEIIAMLLLVVVPGGAVLGGGLAAGLLLLYGGAIAMNLARGRRHIDCGCGGPAGRQPIAPWMVGRNLLLAAAAFATMVRPAARPLTALDGLTVVAAVASLAALYGALDRLAANRPRAARLRRAMG